MQNPTDTRRRQVSLLVALAAVAAANLLLLQTKVEVRNAAGAEVGIETMSTPAAPAPIMAVEAPQLSSEVLAAEREFYEPPPIRLAGVRQEARSWLGDGVMSAPADQIRIEEPDISGIRSIDEVRLTVTELERPELPSLPAIQR